MAAEVIMPKLGMSMVEGTVVAWKMRIGEPVKRGEGIVDISSEKIEMEVESPTDGVLLEITVPDGGVVPYGTVIGYVGTPGEKVNGEAVRSQIKVSPVARKIAEEKGLDLTTIVGTGPQGRITKEDVEKALAADKEDAAVEGTSVMTGVVGTADGLSTETTERIPVSGMRKVIATRMLASLQQSAQLTMTMKVDLTDLMMLRKELAADVQNRFGLKLTVTDFIARAVVISLLQHQRINSAYINETIETYGHVHLGIAVALEKGLVVPVIRHAEKCSLVELSQQIKSLSQRAIDNQLSSDEMKGSTFSISNLGNYGVEFFTPVLNPPETGILGVGALENTPVYRGEELERRSMLPLSFTFDHRVVDGAPAAQFLQTVKRYLEEPYSLLL